ncbi:MAG: type III-A CRISPR-associated RAMP protein Csm5 [Anaerolineae bacterium]|nr:type III-A CRISPR-associated RAMP protein Csm5 [Anaerolineae bacterium]MCI0609634.1 type III-A CRISPR-associated RAMP protein Csm5 [Anaerolineae bacterium]
MSDYRLRWFITTLTPIHVGSGERLREGFDFVEDEGSLWIANQGVLFHTVFDEAKRIRTDDDARIAADIAGMTIYQMMGNNWLRAEHFDLDRNIFLYQLEGKTSKKGKDGELFAHIKDVKNRPYLPGSSLKGALRSTLMRHLAGADKRKPLVFYEEKFDYKTKRTKLKPNPKRAAEFEEGRHFVPGSPVNSREMRLEIRNLDTDPIYAGFAITNPSRKRQDIFHNPNLDIWRAFRISDAVPVPKENLILAKAMVYKRPVQNVQDTQNKSETIPLDLEAIPAGVIFETESWVDKWLFDNPIARRELRFNAREAHWLTDGLRDSVNEESARQLMDERDFFQSVIEQGGSPPPGVDQSIEALLNEFNHLLPNEMLLSVGKGTGWKSKTLGRVLQEKMTDAEFARMVKDFRFGRGKWKRNEFIPYTRVLTGMDDRHNTPLGWVKIRMEAM